MNLKTKASDWLQTLRTAVSNNILIVFLLFWFIWGFCLFFMLLFPLAFINIYCLHSTAAVWWAAAYNKRRKRGEYSLVYKMNSSLISVKIAAIKPVQWDFFIRFLLCRTPELTLETFLKELLCDSDCSAGALSGTWRTCTLRWGFTTTQSLMERYVCLWKHITSALQQCSAFRAGYQNVQSNYTSEQQWPTKMPSPPFNQHSVLQCTPTPQRVFPY